MAHSQYEINVRTQPVMCLQLTDQKTKLNSIIICFFFTRWKDGMCYIALRN